MTITRKQIGRIYAGYKSGDFYGWLDNGREIMNYLYNEVADKTFEEHSDEVVAVLCTINYLNDNSDLGPVHTGAEINKMLNGLLA